MSKRTDYINYNFNAVIGMNARIKSKKYPSITWAGRIFDDGHILVGLVARDGFGAFNVMKDDIASLKVTNFEGKDCTDWGWRK